MVDAKEHSKGRMMALMRVALRVPKKAESWEALMEQRSAVH